MTWKTFLMLAAMLFAWEGSPVAPTGEMVVSAAAALPAAQQGGPAVVVVPLEGLDPVLLTRGKEVQGDEQFAVTRGRFRYLFADAGTRAEFEREPSRYEIQLGGTCARMGPSTLGNPDLFHVHRGRIYLLGSPACLTMFKAAPESFLEPEGPAAAPDAPEEARRRGRELIERAVEAAGGAARVDGLKSYQERGATGAPARQGAAEVKTALVVSLPRSFRAERTFPFGIVVTVVTGTDGFYTTPRMTGELTREQRTAFMQQLRRRPLTILRARREEGFVAAAAGAGRAGGAALELVDVWLGAFSARLGIEAATGRVLTLTFRGRGPTGAFGEVVQTFSDFREAGGLTLPFKTTTTFNGEADPTQSTTLEAVVVNAEVAPALFERPQPAPAAQ